MLKKNELRKYGKHKYNRNIYNTREYRQSKEIKKEIEKRYNIVMFIIVIFFSILIFSLFFLQIVRNDYYKKKVSQLTQKVVSGSSAPRGRIYDRNGKLIVDNTPTKVIYYQKPSNVTTTGEIKIAYKLSKLINIDYTQLKDYDKRLFWIKLHPNKAKAKITDKEWKKLEERKLDADNILELKLKRITPDELNSFTNDDLKAAYIYYLMNVGYSYQEKIIKDEDISDEEYALISENISKLKGINTRLDWERKYLYGDTFRTMIGNISNGLPAELKKKYLKKGYSLNDRVGTSYIEYQYENILKGTKNKYIVLDDGSYQLKKEGKRGSDIELTIDIELQKAVEEILTNQILAAKKEANTKYYNKSFVIISDPKTGQILAMAGKQIKQENGQYQVYDYTPGITTSPVSIGSAVKGASQIVGYNTGALKIGEKRNDTCVKIASTPAKCSWKYLGYIDDITALAKSSNTYQFYTAMKVAKAHYVENQPLSIDTSAFDTYRKTFAQFGLGVKTSIDLPVESLGYKGTSKLPGHLLDFAIGQYDTYTPIQLSQYIGTIANNGTRLKPYLLKSVYSSKYSNLQKKISETKTVELNKIDTKEEYLQRVQKGFRAVMQYGTGVGYVDASHSPAGKTGTAQGFIDTNNDGKVDTETLTTTFVAYAPADNPKVTFTVLSPDVAVSSSSSSYQSSVNKKITAAISKKYFEIYQ